MNSSNAKQKPARERLAELGIPYSEPAFLDYVKRGDIEAVSLMLDAGIRACAVDSEGRSAVTLAALAGYHEIVRKLLDGGARFDDVVNAIHRKSKKKDIWEKLSSVSSVATVVSGLVIAFVGAWFTKSYNDAQILNQRIQQTADQQLKEVEIVEKMIPHLAAKDSREAALAAISVLTNRNLSTKLAEIYKGDGSIKYLQDLIVSSNSSSDEKTLAFTAMFHVLEAVRPTIVKISFTNSKKQEKKDEESGFVAASSDKQSTVIAAYYHDQDHDMAPPFNAILWDGSTSHAKLMQTYGEVAVFSIDVPNLKCLPPSAASPLPGERVLGIGFINEQQPKIQLATIQKATEENLIASYDGNDQVLPGFGGSPFINAGGKVLGFAYSYRSHQHTIARYTHILDGQICKDAPY
jgi:hypothetical protein